MDFVAWGCCLLALLVYFNTWDAGFVYDDRRAILGNPDVIGATPLRQLLSNDFWGTPLTDSGSHGSYRPLCVLSFRLNHRISSFFSHTSNSASSYHVVNVLLHVVSTFLVVRLTRTFLTKTFGVLVTGTLFAVHPVHVEAVAGIVGRADLLACCMQLVCFVFYEAHIRWRKVDDAKQWIALGGCLVTAWAAVLCKETAVGALVICGILELAQGVQAMNDKKLWRSVVILGICLSAILQWRLSLPTPVTSFSTADNPTARSTSLLTRTMTFFYLPVFNFRLLVFPMTLSFDWGMDAVPRITSVFDFRNATSMAFYGIMALLGYRASMQLYYNETPKIQSTKTRKTRTKTKKCLCSVCRCEVTIRHSSTCRAVNNNNAPLVCSCAKIPVKTESTVDPVVSRNGLTLIGIAMLVVPFVPATNLFFYVGFVVAERVLYLPSVGYCLLAGLGAAEAYERLSSKRARTLIASVCLVILLAMAARTVRRNLDWRDEESLYRSAVDVNPPKALGNLGSILSTQGRIAEAKEALLAALKHRPNMADVHYNLGVLYQNQREYDKAVECFQKAIHFRPTLAVAYLNLGASLIASGRCQEAASVLRRCSRLDGSGLRDRAAHEAARLGALLQLGGLYTEQGRLQRALAVYREALHTLPERYPPQGIYHRLGDTLARLHQWTEAERFHRAALDAQPDHVPAHLSYGTMLAQNSSRSVEAEQWFKRAMKLAPDDPSVYHHYGEFLSMVSRQAEACAAKVRAAELAPSDYALVVGAATALRLMDRKSEAEHWYRQAVLLRPDDARSHTNLGAILHLQGRTSQAAASYREALRLQPGDATTLANLAKLSTTDA